MTGPELLRALKVLLAHRTGDIDAKGAKALVGLAYGEESISVKRSRAGAAGGRRSAEARLEATGTAKPNQPLKQRPKQNEFASVGVSGTDAPPSSPPLHSPSSLSPEKPKDLTVVAEGSESKPAREMAPAAADWMSEPLAWRCSEVLGNHALGESLDANSWREVRAVWNAWHEARGVTPIPNPAEPFGTDESILEVLKLLARGYLPSRLEAVARRLPNTEKYRGRVLLWSVMTPAIVDIELAALDSEERARRNRPRPFVAPTKTEDNQTPEERARLAGDARAALEAELRKTSTTERKRSVTGGAAE